MRFDKQSLLLYAVTDRSWTGTHTLYEQVEAALKGGVTCVQLREKDLDDAAFLAQANKLHPLCRQYGVPLIINDNVDVAVQARAEGLHIGQNDGSPAQIRQIIPPDMILGVSVHSLEEAQNAWEQGADYLGVGAVFPTSTKSDASLVPRDILQDICRRIPLPIVAIGGIHSGNMDQLAGTGVDGAALVSAIFAAPEIESACQTLKQQAQQIFHQNAAPGAESLNGEGIRDSLVERKQNNSGKNKEEETR